MGNLPLSRNRTYGSSDPVVSGDLDDLQDCAIAGAHGAIVDTYWGGVARLTGASINGSGDVEWTGSGVAQMPISARVGDVLTGATFWAHGNAGATADFTAARLWRKQADGTLDNLGDTPASNLPNSWASYPITLTAPVAVAAGDSFFLEWVANAAGLLLGTVAVERNHPIP